MTTMDQAVLTAVASPQRRRILQLVMGREVSAGQLAAQFDVSWSAVSQHLRVLKDAALVNERRQGRQRFYSTDSATLGVLEAVLEEMWRHDLDRLAELAEGNQGP
jgi:DNA-binding transcriptional ArsR family regulator